MGVLIAPYILLSAERGINREGGGVFMAVGSKEYIK